MYGYSKVISKNILLDWIKTMCVAIENKSGKFNKVSIENETLRTYANEIAMVVSVGRKARIQLCGIMAEMTEQDIYDQFGGFAEFVEQRLGLKKSQAYDMVRVGRVFGIKRNYNWKPALTAKGGEWTQTQLMALLPMGGTGKNRLDDTDTFYACQSLVDRGMVSPKMTVAEIKEVVKQERHDAKAIEAAKAKREEKKAEQEKAEQEANAKIHGNKIAEIQIWQLSGGEIYAIFDGEEKEFTFDNINEINNLLITARNFK